MSPGGEVSRPLIPRRLPAQEEALCPGPLREGLHAVLAPGSALLDPPERDLGRDRQVTVHPDDACLDPVEDRPRHPHILCPDRGPKPIAGPVRLFYGCVEVGDGHDGEHGAEDLLAEDRRIRTHIGDQGRGVEEPTALPGLAEARPADKELPFSPVPQPGSPGPRSDPAGPGSGGAPSRQRDRARPRPSWPGPWRAAPPGTWARSPRGHRSASRRCIPAPRCRTARGSPLPRQPGGRHPSRRSSGPTRRARRISPSGEGPRPGGSRWRSRYSP